MYQVAACRFFAGGWHLVIWVALVSHHTATGARDYCLDETFNATCKENEVVIIDTAKYGRMRQGRCVRRDYGYIGCSSDVMGPLSERCSGRHTCKIYNIEATLAGYQSCPRDLKSYLKAGFYCQPVTLGQKSSCEAEGFTVVRNLSGFIANVISEENGYGNKDCPWVITSLPGQRVRVTLIDYTPINSFHSRGSGTSGGTQYCRQYATINEDEHDSNIVVCNGNSRHQTVFTSKTNNIHIAIASSKTPEMPLFFLLKYEVFGCPIPPTPLNTVMETDGPYLKIYCNYTDETWQLSCEGDTWKGHIANCTPVAEVWNIGQVIQSSRLLPYGISIIIIVGVALLICVIILIIGLLHIKSKREHKRQLAQHKLLNRSSTEDAEAKSSRPPSLPTPRKQYSSCPRTPNKTKQYNSVPRSPKTKMSNGGEYTQIWDNKTRSPVRSNSVPSSMSRKQHPKIGSPQDLSLLRDIDNNTFINTNTLSPSFSTFKPNMTNHIYESPKFDRKSAPAAGEDVEEIQPFYFELEPDKPGIEPRQRPMSADMVVHPNKRGYQAVRAIHEERIPV